MARSTPNISTISSVTPTKVKKRLSRGSLPGIGNDLYGKIVLNDSRKELKKYVGKVDLIATSPPYADARKNHYDSIHPDEFVDWFLTFHEPFFNALKPSGSLVINIKDKVINGTRHRYVWHTIEAFSKLGWKAIDDYIWVKNNPMPGKWPSRLRDGWEYCFHLAKVDRPYMDQDAVRVPIGDWTKTRLKKLGENDLSRHNSDNKSGFGRNIQWWVDKETVLPSNVLALPLVGKNYNHPAVFPVGLPEFFIKLLCPPNGLVVDPFSGSGTTGIAALKLRRNFLLIDNNSDYITSSIERLLPSAENAGVQLEY